MTRLLEIALLLSIILGCAHVIQLDKDWDHVARTPEFEQLRIKHGLKNTEMVWVEKGRNWYYNERRQVCELR